MNINKFGSFKNLGDCLDKGYIYMNETQNFKDHSEKIFGGSYCKDEGEYWKYFSSNFSSNYIKTLYVKDKGEYWKYFSSNYIKILISVLLHKDRKIEPEYEKLFEKIHSLVWKWQGINLDKIVHFLTTRKEGICFYCLQSIIKAIHLITISVFYTMYLVNNLAYLGWFDSDICNYVDETIQVLSTNICDRSEKCQNVSNTSDSYNVFPSAIIAQIITYTKENNINIDQQILKNIELCINRYIDVLCSIIEILYPDFFYKICCFTSNACDNLKMYDVFGPVCLELEPIQKDNKLYFEVSKNGKDYVLEEIRKVNYNDNAEYINLFGPTREEDIVNFYTIKNNSYKNEKEYRILCKKNDIKDKKLYINFEKHLKKIVLISDRDKNDNDKNDNDKNFDNFFDIIKNKTLLNPNFSVDICTVRMLNKKTIISKLYTVKEGKKIHPTGAELISIDSNIEEICKLIKSD